MILQNHKWLPVCIFQSQNCLFRVYEAGYWKNFQNYIFKGASYNFDFDFFIN